MSKQYPGGLITKTPVTPTSLSASGVWSLSDQAKAQASNTWPFPRDPQFNYVTMLLHGDGSAGVPSTGSGAGASTTVTNFNADASTNNFNVTINGDARSDNFTPYQAGYYSNYFGGSGNSINYPSATQYAIGTGNFTLEFFVNFSALNAGHNRMFAIGASGTDGLEIDLNGTNLEVGIQNGYPIGYTWVPTVGTWYYMAVTRSGSTVTLYINGTSVATGTSSNSISQNSLSIGGITWQSTWSINGFLSNVRLSNTVRTIATPTAPYTSDANTLFLGAQSNRFLDTSSYAATATATGSPQVSPAIPFTLPTTVATYGSGYFDGTGDYLGVTGATTALAFGSGDFTIEFWGYILQTTPEQMFIDWRPAGTQTTQPLIYVTSAGVLAYYVNAANRITGATLSTSTWYHIAVSRSGTSTKMFLNGVQTGSTWTDTTVYTNTSTRPVIGLDGNTGNSGYLKGNVTDVRTLTGTALYTTTFTPPTAPLTAITNTSLLTTQYNGGGNNSGFKDSSQFNFPITRNGNTTQGTFSPYGSNWSYSGNGSTTYALAPNNTAFDQNAAFTLEWYDFLVSNGSAQAPFYVNTSGYLTVYRQAAGGYQLDRSGSGSLYLSSAYSWSAWHYIAISYDGTNTRMYVDGVLLYTYAGGGVACGTTPELGRGNGGINVNGYISNLRFTKSALYTGSTMTVPTSPLTAITNCTFLAFQSNRWIDNSTSNLTITPYNSPSVQRFSPFAPLVVYNPVTNGASAYFDGTTDFLTVPKNTALEPATSGAWTLETWVYGTSTSDMRVVAYANSTISSGPDLGYYLTLYSANNITGGFYSSSTQYNISASSTVAQINTWIHIALTSDGSTMRLFVNGVSSGTPLTVSGIAINAPSSATFKVSNYSSSQYVTGYVTDTRFVKGTAVYTSNFTPPTAPLTAITNTSLLLNYTNPAILDNSMLNNLETVGNAAVSTSVKKYGAASMVFDGTGDALYSTSQSVTFGTGDFTIEFWIYFNAVNNSTVKFVYDMRNSGATSAAFFAQETDNSWSIYNGAGALMNLSIGGSTFTASTWYHVAICRSSGVTKGFVNGTLTGSQNDTSSYSTSTLTIAARYTQDNATNCYLDDLRITKYARYTASFTAPTQAFPNG